jgi:enoyl-CoA hydratase
VISIESSGPVMVATLQRSSQNTIDDALAAAIDGALSKAEEGGAVLLHLRSSSEHFCGGADPARVTAWLGDAGAGALLADSRRWAQLFERIECSHVIILAEMRGNALGAGLGLALACDLRMASASARIGVPEVRVGLLPAGMTVHRLACVAGEVTAQRLLLAGELIDGTEAYRLGIVHWVVADAELAAQAAARAQQVARQSPAALREAKRVLAATRRGEARATLAAENLAFSRLIADEEPRQRIRALLGRLDAAARRDTPPPAP